MWFGFVEVHRLLWRLVRAWRVDGVFDPLEHFLKVEAAEVTAVREAVAFPRKRRRPPIATTRGTVGIESREVKCGASRGYRMRPGIVETTNALALMRQMSLDV